MKSPSRGRSRRALAAGLLAGALIACGGGVETVDGPAPPPIDAAVDAVVDAVEPPIDAPTDGAAPPSRSELTGGGRLTGGTLVMDVQLGHPAGQAPSSAGATVLQPASAIKP